MPTISPFLWFNTEAEEAAKFYVSVFKNSKIMQVTHYPKSVEAITGSPEGSVMTVHFELDGQPFIAINGGPQFKFSEAISLVVYCKDQAELDEYWNKLSAVPASEQCGWLKDKYGLSWQIVPANLAQLLEDSNDPAKVDRVMQEVMSMKKLNIQKMEQARAA